MSCDAAKGVRKLNPAIDDKVIVSGIGTMGLLTLLYLKIFYEVKHVDVIEPNPNRQEMAKKFGASHVYTVQEAPDDCYDMAFECSATDQSFASLQESVRAEGKICILSDGNKEEFKLLPIFFEKELSLVGSSDGWDYKKHFEWYFSIVSLMPHLTDIFEYEIRDDEVIEVFHQLSRHEIHPLKIAVLYQ